MWTVFVKKQKDEFTRRLYYGAEFPDIPTKENLMKKLSTDNYDIFEPFQNQEEVDKFIEETTFENIKQYTKNMAIKAKTKDHIWPTIIHFKCISVFAYIGDNITIYPGIYRIHLDDFCFLKKKFKSVRLACDNELENYIDGSYIVNKSEITDDLLKLDLASTFFIPHNLYDTGNFDKKFMKELINNYDVILNHLLADTNNIIKIYKALDAAYNMKQPNCEYKFQNTNGDNVPMTEEEYEDVRTEISNLLNDAVINLVKDLNKINFEHIFLKNKYLTGLDEIKKYILSIESSCGKEPYIELIKKLKRIGIEEL